RVASSHSSRDPILGSFLNVFCTDRLFSTHLRRTKPVNYVENFGMKAASLRIAGLPKATALVPVRGVMQADEEDRSDHQALQAGRGEGCPEPDRPQGDHGARSEGLRTSEGPYGTLSWRRVRRRLPAQGEDRADHRGRDGREGRRDDTWRGAHRPHRRRQDLRLADRGSHPNSYWRAWRRRRMRTGLWGQQVNHSRGTNDKWTPSKF